ncbi:hypothetical protein ABZP36_016929 [Zizania latifolia]
MDHYWDFFSQAASSSTATRIFRYSQDVGDEDDFGPFTSPPTPCLSAPCRHMEHLNLNSQADGFPNLGSYQEYLQADDVGGDHGLPPRAPGGRMVDHGGGRGGRRSRSTNTGAGSEGGRVGSRRGAVATRGGRGEALGDRWCTAMDPLLSATPSSLQSNLASKI